MFKLFKKIFTIPCPNCESAWTGGHPDPDSITWCMVCSNPKTGEMRGWSWRYEWLARMTVAANFRNKKWEDTR